MRTVEPPAPPPALAPPSGVRPDAPATHPAPAEAAPPAAARACPNCAHPAPLAYCPQCGQAQHALHRSLRAWAGELLDTFAGWDGKIPQTLWLLFRYPGRLTAEYLAGRRARYLPPLRLYLLLVVVLVLANRVSPTQGGLVQINLQKVAEGATHEDPAPRPAGRAATPAPSAAAPRAAAPLDTGLTRSGPWRKLKRSMFGGRVRALERMDPGARAEAVRSAFLAKVGNMFFVLVPVFALLTRALYWRRPLVYAEHLVFALHMHALAAGALAVVALLPEGWAAIPVVAAPAALFVALRRVFGGSRRRTALRFAALSVAYLVALFVATTVTVALAFLVG